MKQSEGALLGLLRKLKLSCTRCATKQFVHLALKKRTSRLDSQKVNPERSPIIG